MASSSSIFGDLFAGKSGQQTQALVLGDFTITRSSSALQPVGDTDVEMATPEKRIVTATAWLSYMYSELHKEIKYLGNVILEIQRQQHNPRHIAPDICAAYELALHYQRQLYESDAAKLRNALRDDYLRFEAASKQFAGEVQMGIQYLALRMEQRTLDVGNELHSQINMAAAVNAAQMQRIDKWTTSSENAYSALRLQMEADKRSVDAVSKELETVKKDQARQRAESIAQHEKLQKAQQLAEDKHKKFLALTDANMSRVSKTFKGLEKELKEELKDQWTEDRFEEFKKLQKTAKATIKTSSSKPDGPPNSPRHTPTPPPTPPPPPWPPPKPPGAGPEDKNLKGSKKGKEKKKGVEKSKKGSKDGSKKKSKKGSADGSEPSSSLSIIIIIIFHEAHAAYRLWRGYIHFGIETVCCPFVSPVSLQTICRGPPLVLF